MPFKNWIKRLSKDFSKTRERTWKFEFLGVSTRLDIKLTKNFSKSSGKVLTPRKVSLFVLLFHLIWKRLCSTLRFLIRNFWISWIYFFVSNFDYVNLGLRFMFIDCLKKDCDWQQEGGLIIQPNHICF